MSRSLKKGPFIDFKLEKKVLANMAAVQKARNKIRAPPPKMFTFFC